MALSALPAPLGHAPPSEVVGVALPSRIGAFGGGAAFGRRGGEWAAGGLRSAPPQPADETPAVAQAQLVAALLSQVQALGPAPSHDNGRCRPAEARRLRCDHAEADEAVAAAAPVIATLLQTLAAVDPRLREPALAYAEGRFSVTLR